MTRVVGSRLQPYRMETCDTEEPDEGNLHVRFCGGIGRAIADSTRTHRAAIGVRFQNGKVTHRRRMIAAGLSEEGPHWVG